MSSKDIYLSFLEFQQLILWSKCLKSKDSAERLDYESKLDHISNKIEKAKNGVRY